MPTLPPLLVELKANASSITAAMTKAREEIEKTAKTTETASDRMAQVGKVAFIGLSAAAVGFGAIAVKAALEGEQAHALLVNAVQNSGTAFKSVGGAVEEMSGRFAKLGFQNDVVEASLARMVTASGSTKTAMDNMGLAADLARARHIGLEEASNALGKILAGNMKGMTAFGLSTKDASGNVLTTAAALAELNQRFGGAAAANADTYAGKLQAMNAEWHNMVEAVGNMLLPVLADAAGVIANVVGWFEKHAEVAGVLAGVIGGPLVAAMVVYAAQQAMAFAASVAGQIQRVATAIFGIVPAAEAAEGAEAGLAAETLVMTGGLAAVGAILGGVALHFLGHASATKEVGSAAEAATGPVSVLTAAEGDLGDATATTNGPLKEQASLFKKLADDTNAQQSELLTLVGDTNTVDGALQKLKDSTGANSEVTKQATQHTKDLAAAEKTEKDAADKVTEALKKQSDAKKKLDDLMKPQTERNITDAADAHEAANDRLTRSTIGVKDKTVDLNKAISEYGPNSDEAKLAQLDLNDALREAHDAMNAVSDTTQTMGDAQRQTIGTTDQIKDATTEFNDATKAVTDAQTKQKDAQTTLNSVLADSGAVKAARDDAKNLADNTLAWEQATLKQTTDWATLQATIGSHPELRDQLVGQLKGMKDNLPKGADTKPISDLIDKLNGIDIAKAQAGSLFLVAATSKMTFSADDTASIVAMLRGDTGVVPPPGVVTQPRQGGPMPPAPVPGTNITQPRQGRAVGGPVYPWQDYLVGEAGPEILRMGSAGGTVVPNSGGGGMNVTVNIIGNGRDDTELAVAVRDELVRLGRSNGSTPGI